ncbi:phosphonate ABC transporter ATP-binding protein [Motilimonas cestriensis]|uniref:Phosphonate ABC transporter ATP-binding protein n=1 Tax=Motilimonas cestriensis TaxID=2742685 RepID=A0ABS8WGZ6_9GAMM|nr:phosphonate ABC transporter ATP-binding protein [Motilimonas cestriensis]MCE2596645.1 phosphonate ABC transporter ATP-binding protein [Motilimonas cestriensis]
MNKQVISVQQLNKHFANNHALKNVGLSVEQGEMVALLGPSGSGKSTLLRHLNGLVCGDKTVNDKPSNGYIEVLGVPVQKNGKFCKTVRASRCQTGYIFQQFNLVTRLSVLQNVLIGGLNSTPLWRSLTGRFTLAQKQQAMNALERVGLADFATQRVSNLSGGQQQRVAIARALMQQAKIILADEPIASLDPESSRIVMDILSDINKKEGIAVVVTLHQVDYAVRYCPRVVALKKGEVFFDGPSEQLDEGTLAALYGSKVTPPQSNKSKTPVPQLWAQTA